MSYRPPSAAFDITTLLDPQVTEDIINPFLYELAQLNEHNVKEATIGAAKRGDACFYDFHTYMHNANMEITAGNNWRPTATNGVRVPDSGEWSVVSSTTWTGSDDRVWCLAQVQYGMVDPNTFSITTNYTDKARVQFAFRINGVLVETTVTGRNGESSVDYLGLPSYPNQMLKADNASTDTLKVHQINANGFHVAAPMIQHTQPVPAGTVLVEVVVRRVPPAQGANAGAVPNGVPLYTYSHRLVVVQIKDGIERADSPALAAVTYPQPGDAYTSTSFSGFMTPARTTINALSPSNIVPSGLRWEHLSDTFSQVREGDQTVIVTGTTTARVYPGYGTGGIVGVGNWSEVNDGAGTNLRVTGTPWDYAASHAFVLILGNLHFTKASDPGAIRPELYGVFGINQHFSGGSDAMITEMRTNSPNVTPAFEQYDCDVDVPLLGFIDYRTSAPGAGSVAYYRTVCTGDGFASVTTEWERGNLMVIHFYK